MKRILLISVALFSSFVNAESLDTFAVGIWSISETNEMRRWIVIHNLDEAKSTGIYHIEVIGRNHSSEAWQIKYLVRHMAITKEALSHDVIKPLNRGAVYPESFQTAYNEWQGQNNGKGGSICKTSLLECM